MKFALSCASGLESLVKKELQIAGYSSTRGLPTLVRFDGDQSAIVKLNLRSRVSNKLYIELASGQTHDFDALFALVHAIDRAKYIDCNPIIVTAITRKSKLSSGPTIQSIGKKAIIKKILIGSSATRVEEDASLPPIEIVLHIQDNECLVLLNTTGDALHKRAYRQATGEAPINEALAAGIVLLSGWKFAEPLYDVFCGSGTIAIEAAMIAKNIAPGLMRSFAFEHWKRYDPSILAQEKQLAKAKMMLDKEHTIIASDIDPKMIEIAKANAKNAGVDHYIQFAVKDMKDYITQPAMQGCLVSNPPYGLRMTAYDLIALYRTIRQIFHSHADLRGGIITTYADFIDLKDAAHRKKTSLYTGGEQCRLYKKI